MSNSQELKRAWDGVVAGASHWVERFRAEVDFAEGLAKIRPEAAKAWEKLLADARAVVAEAIASGQSETIEPAVLRAEEMLAPVGAVCKQYTIHCVGHAHIDMNWMWSWPETMATTNDTFTTVLQLMKEFPQFTFSQSQASVYAIVQQYNPQLFEQIKKRVDEGRWEVTASHWVEGDRNMVGGESLARHLLYTRRYMKKSLGLKYDAVQVDWCPDTFGHAHTIPSIDARGGVKYYYLCRPGEGEKPAVFWWKAPDGGRVLVNRETTWYNGSIEPANALALVNFAQKTGLKDWLNVYGVGDHGGGPTRRDIRRLVDMNTWPIYPNLRFGTVAAYFKLLEQNSDNWPMIDRELNFEFAGCYTTQTQIKRNNRYGENILQEAEAAAAVTWCALGREYPQAILEQNWIDQLFSHFHDILPGSGVRATREFNSAMFQKVSAAGGMIKTQSLRALAAAVNTAFADLAKAPGVTPEQESMGQGGGVGRNVELGTISSAAYVTDGPRGALVFNPLGWARGQTVLATIWDADGGANAGNLRDKQFVVHSPDGETVPAQVVHSGDYWGHKFSDIVFPTSAGGLGYTAYVIEEGEVQDYAGTVKKTVAREGGGVNLPDGEVSLENELIKVSFDKRTGGVVSLVDKATGADLASRAEPAGLLEYVLEQPTGMSAWVLGDVAKRICPLEVESIDTGGGWGPHQASVIVKAKLNDSRFTIIYTLRAGQPWLEVAVSCRWLERGGPDIGTPRLAMRFPLALADAKGTYEIPFGAIERDVQAGREVPALRWADVNGSGDVGCALLNDSKYGHSLDGSTLRLTLIRSSYDPDPLPEIGEHNVRMALVPHGRRLDRAELVKLGAAFNQPLIVVNTDIHKGKLPAQSKGVEVSEVGVILTGVKKAEDERALVFRFQETAGQTTTVKVSLDGKLYGKPSAAAEVDLLEREIKGGSAKVMRDGFSVSVPAFGVASVKVRM